MSKSSKLLLKKRSTHNKNQMCIPSASMFQPAVFAHTLPSNPMIAALDTWPLPTKLLSTYVCQDIFSVKKHEWIAGWLAREFRNVVVRRSGWCGPRGSLKSVVNFGQPCAGSGCLLCLVQQRTGPSILTPPPPGWGVTLKHLSSVSVCCSGCHASESIYSIWNQWLSMLITTKLLFNSYFWPKNSKKKQRGGFFLEHCLRRKLQ